MLKDETKTVDDFHTDKLYIDKIDNIGDFVFDHRVANVFADMQKRSTPGYEPLTQLTGIIVGEHLCEGDKCYDLGCALGNTIRSILMSIEDRDVSVVGIDSSKAMLVKARENVIDSRVEFKHGDIRSVNLEECDVVILNFALQYVPISDRDKALNRIHRKLRPGGILILSENVQIDKDFELLHDAFKRGNGYSDLEIEQSKRALSNVEFPESLVTHLLRLQRIGFQNVKPWFQCMNWVSLLATA